MEAQLVVQNLLREELVRIQATNPRYSLRAYATKVGVHVGALSSILNGKRNVSRSLAERIAHRLMLDPQRRAEVLSVFPAPKASRPRRATDGEGKLDSRYLELSAQSFRIMSEWEHFAVLCLFHIRGFRPDSTWIAAKLRITEAKAETVVARMVDLGLIERVAGGGLRRTTRSVRTTDDVADLSLKKCHEQSLDLARTSLYRDPVHLRDHTSITMAIDPSKIGKAKEVIRKFQDDLSDLLESGTPTEVYRLSMQLFPLSTPEKSP